MPDSASGILKLSRQGGGTLVSAALNSPTGPSRPPGEIVVPARLVRENRLVEGATVAGPLRQSKQGLELASIESVCGCPVAEFQARPAFARLVAVDPSDRFHLSASGEVSGRVIDLAAPIGRGTRGLIVSPPKAGKTMLLEQVARGIRADEPDARIIVLLIDERPEELTYFRRAVSAEVFASSSDQSPREHVELGELMMAHIRTEVECGHDVVVLLDSLTRLVRAFNLTGPRGGRAPGRTLSGGVEAGALEIPRRLFGLARNIEGGGSITIVATMLVDTGSRMDQLIYEEFKGTGNSEIILDRGLAQAGIFPALDLAASGTRKEERLYSPEDAERLRRLRRTLADYGRKEAMLRLLRMIEQYPTNEQLLQSLSPGAKK